jgi:hypothetical protein
LLIMGSNQKSQDLNKIILTAVIIINHLITLDSQLIIRQDEY